MSWDVEFHALFVPEFGALAEAVQDELLAHVAVLETAFAFDPARRAIVLCGGDKAGVSKSRFYDGLIARADRRFGQHLKNAQRTARVGKRP